MAYTHEMKWSHKNVYSSYSKSSNRLEKKARGKILMKDLVSGLQGLSISQKTQFCTTVCSNQYLNALKLTTALQKMLPRST